MLIQLNGDRLDPAHGLVAVDAEHIVSGYRLDVVGKSRLFEEKVGNAIANLLGTTVKSSPEVLQLKLET
jgi:hypothetical protein